MSVPFSAVAEAVFAAKRDNDLMQIYEKHFPIYTIRGQLYEWIDEQKWTQCAEHIASQELCDESNTFSNELVAEFIGEINHVIGQDIDSSIKISLRRELATIEKDSCDNVVIKMTTCLNKERDLYHHVTDPNYVQTEEAILEQMFAELQDKSEQLKNTCKEVKVVQERCSFEIPMILAALTEVNEIEKKKIIHDTIEPWTLDFAKRIQDLQGVAQLCNDQSKVIRVKLSAMLREYKRQYIHHYIGFAGPPPITSLQNFFSLFGKLLLCLWDEIQGGLSSILFYNKTPKIKEIGADLLDALCLEFKERFSAVLHESFLVIRPPSPILLVQGAHRGSSLKDFPASVSVLACERIIGDLSFPVSASFESQHIDETQDLGVQNFKRQASGIIADFPNISIKDFLRPRKRRSSAAPDVSVYEHRYQIRFKTSLMIGQETFTLETVSLPLLVTTNTSQNSDCRAALMWQCFDPDLESSEIPFPESLPWRTVGEMLSREFEVKTGRGLNSSQRKFLGSEIAGVSENHVHDEMMVTWAQFNKPRNKPMRFWEWFDGILKLVKDCLEKPWQDGLILGFVSAKFVNKLSRDPRIPDNTYLFRFSTNVKSTINIDIVSTKSQGRAPSSRYEASEFKNRNLGLVVKHSVYNEEPLKFLYHNGQLLPTEEVFAEYLTEKAKVGKTAKVESSPYVTYIPRSVLNVLNEIDIDDDCDDMGDDMSMTLDSPGYAGCLSAMEPSPEHVLEEISPKKALLNTNRDNPPNVTTIISPDIEYSMEQISCMDNLSINEGGIRPGMSVVNSDDDHESMNGLTNLYNRSFSLDLSDPVAVNDSALARMVDPNEILQLASTGLCSPTQFDQIIQEFEDKN